MPTQDLMDAIRGLKIPELQELIVAAEKEIESKRESEVVNLAEQFETIATASLGMTAKQLMAAARKARREKDEEVMSVEAAE